MKTAREEGSVETRRDHLARLASIAGGSLATSACGTQSRTAPAPAPGATDPRRRIRVGLLVGANRARIGAQGNVVALEGGRTVLRLSPGESVSVDPQGSGLRAAGGGQSANFGSLTFRPGARNSMVTVNGEPYRDTLAVSASGGSLRVINEIGLEAYVQGVVSAEMGPRSSAERAALEAQAIASRTYAVANLGRFQRQGFDVRAGISDQAYRGARGETAEGNTAVRNTSGLVLTFQGEVAAIFFHSTCGYATASPEEVFRSVRPRPYLVSVSDRWGDGYYCEDSPRFRWQVQWGGDQLRNILRTTVPNSLGVDGGLFANINDVQVRTTGQSGRATEIRIRVERGEIPVFGPDVRAVFQTPEGRPLGSTAVQLSSERHNDQLTNLTAAGAGWGHGVGMCQWGAIGRARARHSYGAILSAYFPGSEISRWY